MEPFPLALTDRCAQACASASGSISAWAVDSGNKVGILEGVDPEDKSLMEKMIDIANDASIGMAIHSTGGVMLTASGHHLADNLPAVRQYAGAVMSSLPDCEALPRESHESACVALYYTCILHGPQKPVINGVKWCP